MAIDMGNSSRRRKSVFMPTTPQENVEAKSFLKEKG